MLRNKALKIEIETDLFESYPSFTAEINIGETDKNIKQEEIFGRIINQLPPDNDTVYIGYDKILPIEKQDLYKKELKKKQENKEQNKKTKLFIQLLYLNIIEIG